MVASTVYKDYVKPQNWRKNIWDLDPEKPENNGLQNEDLIVWMRTAALPTFRKLYRRLNRDVKGYTSGLTAGVYYLSVEYSNLVSNCIDFSFQSMNTVPYIVLLTNLFYFRLSSEVICWQQTFYHIYDLFAW